MKTTLKNFGMLLGLVLGFTLLTAATGSTEPPYVLTPRVEFSVAGTSTLHDWEMVSKSGVGKADIETDGEVVTAVNAVSIQLPASSLKSGTSGMDKNAYKALKVEDHPYIRFSLEDLKPTKTVNGVSYFKATGDLMIAGTKKRVTLDATGKVNGDEVSFEGRTAFNLTDFQIEPPTAMFGTIETGDKVTVAFTVTLKNQR